VAAAFMALILLRRTPDFMPFLRVVIPFATAAAVLASVALHNRRAVVAWAVAGAIAVLAGPAAYAADNLGHALNGNNVLAGPTSAGGMGGPGGGFQAGGASRAGGMPGGGLSTQAIRYLETHQGSAKYLVAANGAQTTSSIITSTGKPVVTIGGFSGQDAAPTLSQLKSMVAKGELKYVLVSSGGQGGPGGRGGPGGGNSSLTSWVTQHGSAVKGLGSSGGTLYRVSA
jgi:4-amino-4-deoxy-L-arabinose transferase-like glycosyltransferase